MRIVREARRFWPVLKLAVNGWVDHRASSMGAAIAYYTALSLAPLLLIVISVAGLVFGRDAAQGALVTQLQELIGADGAHAVQTVLASAKDIGGSLVSIAVGVVVLTIGATTVFAELQADLDRIWDTPTPPGNGLWNWVRTRLLSIGMVLGVGFLLMVSLLLSAAVAAIGKFWGDALGARETIAQALNFAVGFCIITALFAAIFKFLPSRRIAWRDVWTGAAVTSLLFAVGKSLIGLYLGKAAVSSSFGAAGAFVVLIVWIYYAAQIFLLGAEFTHQYARLHGSLAKAGAQAPGERRDTATAAGHGAATR